MKIHSKLYLLTPTSNSSRFHASLIKENDDDEVLREGCSKAMNSRFMLIIIQLIFQYYHLVPSAKYEVIHLKSSLNLISTPASKLPVISN